MLEHTLSTQRIHLDVDASTKKRVLEKIVDLCCQSESKQDYFHALVEREKLGSTGLGYGVALPHARIAGIDEPMACFIRLESPIDFDSPDGKGVDLIVGLLVPEDSQESHLQLLADIAECFNDEKTRAALRAATNPDEAFNIIITQHKGEALAS